MCWRSCKDLTWPNNLVLCKSCTSCQHCECFNFSTSCNWWAHSNKSIIFDRTSIKIAIGSNIHIVTNRHLVALLWVVACNSSQILDSWIFANCNLCSVTPYDHTVPERRTSTQMNVADYCSVWCNPVTIKQFRENSLWSRHAAQGRDNPVFVCRASLVSHSSFE